MLELLLEQKQQQIAQLVEIGYSLTTEKNFDSLMETILLGAKNLSNADGGTLYLMSDDSKYLEFKVVQTDSLGIAMGGTKDVITWNKLPLYKEDGTQNKEMVAVLCALSGKLFNIEDVYIAEGFNFEGTKKFDSNTGYRTKSMLIVPMRNHENDVIGVLQLLNKQDTNKNIISFNKEDEKLILSMSSQAAVSITNNRLIADFEKLLDSFIKAIASAIDEKSPYTGGHIGRVADLMLLVIDAIDEDEEFFPDKKYNKDEKKELKYAAWMHDIGKITTKEYVVDKATKLETVFNRLTYIIAKIEIKKRDLKIDLLENKITLQVYDSIIKGLDDDIAFLKTVNKGSEFTDDSMIERIQNIAKKTIFIQGQETHILDDDEVLNLSIRRGTLTNEERKHINNHALVSLNMLNNLHFPKKLRKVPSIAGGHHEKICGGGYPLNLKGDEISFETRILTITDIFEALTASDRPYKSPNTLNQALAILVSVAKNGELDKTLVKFFIEKKLYLSYAKKNLLPSQMDEVIVTIDNL